MPILFIVLLFFIVVPLIEIYLLIEVGSIIGALATVFAVLFTAVLGVVLIRIQGFATLQKAQSSMQQGVLPAMEMFEGLMLLLAALCLLIPGFFTDAFGFLLLIPILRRLLAKQIISNMAFKQRFSRQTNAYDSDSRHCFEGEYENITPGQDKPPYIIEGTVDNPDKTSK